MEVYYYKHILVLLFAMFFYSDEYYAHDLLEGRFIFMCRWCIIMLAIFSGYFLFYAYNVFHTVSL